MTIAETLRAGKARIERGPWGKGKGASPPRGDACCVVTAIAGPSHHYHSDVIELFERANGIDSAIGVIAWNDAPERTKEEVLAAFDKAITLAEQENA